MNVSLPPCFCSRGLSRAVLETSHIELLLTASPHSLALFPCFLAEAIWYGLKKSGCLEEAGGPPFTSASSGQRATGRQMLTWRVRKLL